MHDEIIRYSLEGTMTDGNLVSRKEQYVHFVETWMRDEGVVPNLDLDPQFTLDYDATGETFRFSLSVYGNFVGGQQAWQAEGMTLGTMVMKPTFPIKSKESFATPK